MCVNHKLKEGDLVKLKIFRKSFTNDGFSTLGYHPNPMYGALYEYINIQTYPSSRDFLGRSVAVKHNQEAMILKYVGRPLTLQNPAYSDYDIYEVLVDGYTCYVFNYNIEPVCIKSE